MLYLQKCFMFSHELFNFVNKMRKTGMTSHLLNNKDTARQWSLSYYHLSLFFCVYYQTKKIYIYLEHIYSLQMN